MSRIPETGEHGRADMTAIVIDDYGGPDRLRVDRVPMPVARAGEVLVEIAAIGVNPADLKWRSGRFRNGRPLTFPHILGYDIAGTVRGLSGGDGTLHDGLPVFAMLSAVKQGAYAQWASVPADLLAPIPEGLDMCAAAALPTAGLTALQLIEDHLAVSPGDRVMVTGATGAVGRISTGLAKAAGAHVTAVVRPCHVAEARSLGADAVATLEEVLSSSASYDRIADTIGGPAVAGIFDRLAPGGVACTISVDAIPRVPGGPTIGWFRVAPAPDQLVRLGRAYLAGAISLPLSIFAMTAAADVHRQIEAGLSGKAVLIP